MLRRLRVPARGAAAPALAAGCLALGFAVLPASQLAAERRATSPGAARFAPPCAPAAHARAPQSELGDVVYVELPAVGATLTAGKTFGVVESVKARRGATPPAPLAPRPLQRRMALEIASPCRVPGRPTRLGGDRSGTACELRCAGLNTGGATAANALAWRRSQAASDVYSPVSGTVVETNGALADAPATARALSRGSCARASPARGRRPCKTPAAHALRSPLPAGEQQPLRRRLDDEGQAVQPGGCAAREMLLHALGIALRTLFATLTRLESLTASAEVQKLMDAKKYSAHCEAGGH